MLSNTEFNEKIFQWGKRQLLVSTAQTSKTGKKCLGKCAKCGFLIFKGFCCVTFVFICWNNVQKMMQNTCKTLPNISNNLPNNFTKNTCSSWELIPGPSVEWSSALPLSYMVSSQFS